MTNSIDDITEQAEAYFIIGSNTTEQHPVIGIQIRQAVEKRGAKLVLADPRRIDIADLATIHLRQRPGTDIALLNGLMNVILEGLVGSNVCRATDREHRRTESSGEQIHT